MKRQCFSLCKPFFVYLLVLESILAGAAALTRGDFPPGFIFGAGTSAYQVEGAAAEDGRKPSIWDTYTHAGLTADKGTGDVAADQYHKYKEDVKLMHEMGLDAYRLSISWSRLIPDGRGPVNPKGLQYYNNLIDELVSYGIDPHVTLLHLDLPQALEDEYEGLLSPRIVEDFTAYADICFKEFGDRVKYWGTFNEPDGVAVLGYDDGVLPPQHCSYPFGYSNCSKGDSTREPYRSAHNYLLSHASAAALYKEKYQAMQGGQIGITIRGSWYMPFTDSDDDIAAAQRARDFNIGWFMDPLVYGNYPAIMREIVGSRLPSFDAEESKKLKGSLDFIGFNHYSLFYVQSYPNNYDKNDRDFYRDVSVKLIESSNATEAFGKGFTMHRTSAAWTLQPLLDYVRVKYGNPPVMLHEIGYGEFVWSTPWNSTYDNDRVTIMRGNMESLLQAIRNGSNAQGYFVWSFIDGFELMYGYTVRYGLYGVDFNRADKRRFPRLSAHWYSNFLSSSRLRSPASNIMHAE